MAEQTQSAVQALNSEPWRALSLRSTFFPLEPVKPRKQTWWHAVVQTDPEESVDRAGYHQESGKLKDAADNQLLLIVQPLRIDWIIRENPAQLSVLEPPAPKALNVALAALKRLVSDWTIHCPPVNRIAFGAELLQWAKTVSEANQALAKYLAESVKIDTESSLDFQYRINRPRLSTVVADLRINRLSTWSLVQGVAVNLPLDMPTRVTAAAASAGLKLDLDINNQSLPSGELPRDKIVSLFEELVGLGLEISEKGDVK